MQIQDLGLMRYKDAWAIQEAAHEEVVAGGDESIILVEHYPVITYGRRPGVDKNLIASTEQLARLGVEIVQSDRGGDITFHGPGQLVVYPIIRLADHRLSVSGYVHALESIIIESLAKFGVPATADPAAVGVWTPRKNDKAGDKKGPGPYLPYDGAVKMGPDPILTAPACSSAKVCAIGVRIRRGVSLHGLALNVTTNLRFFNLIVPCGLRDRPVTSLQELLGDRAPAMPMVKSVLIECLLAKLGIGKSLES